MKIILSIFGLAIIITFSYAAERHDDQKKTSLSQTSLDPRTLKEIEILNTEVIAGLKGKTIPAEEISHDASAKAAAGQTVASNGYDPLHEKEETRLGKPTSGDAPTELDIEKERKPIEKAIFGEDDRWEPKDKSPYKNIGKLIFENGWCTAALIGPRHILTAAHCFTREKDGVKAASFVPFYREGEQPYGASNVIHVYWGKIPPASGKSEDFAVAILDKRLGDELGWLGWRSINDDWLIKGPPRSTIPLFYLAGYSSDWYSAHRLGVTSVAKLFFRAPDDPYVIGHDGDMSPGASGGPLFANFGSHGWQVVCVNIWEPHYAHPHGKTVIRAWKDSAPYAGIANRCTDVARVTGAIKKALNEWP